MQKCKAALARDYTSYGAAAAGADFFFHLNFLLSKLHVLASIPLSHLSREMGRELTLSGPLLLRRSLAPLLC